MEKAIQTLLPGFFILITVVILGMLVYLTLKGREHQLFLTQENLL